MRAVEVRLLGPVRVEASDRPVNLGVRMQRFVLAVLALEANRMVATERLIDLTWPEEPPLTARRIIHSQISRLRATLASARADTTLAVRRAGPGYLLECEPELVDAHRFTALLTRARTVSGDPERAALLDRAVALWRGPALADSASEQSRAALCGHLEEARLTALEDLLDVYLRQERYDLVTAEATRHSAEHPHRERLTVALVTALHRAGRSADALNAYQRARKRLADDLGLDPSAELRRLELSILRDGADPEDLPAPAPPTSFTLPPDTATFTGRSEELRKIVDGARDAGRGGLVVIAGMPGIGKTALAVHAAHHLAGSADRRLFIDLHAHTPGQRPISAGDALAQLLAADGVDPRHLPESVDERSAMWRDRMAERRLLLVLDNADSTDQVAPLLPGTPGCRVLVTSRRSLGDLPAALALPLDVLPEEQAVRMFLRLAPHGEAEPDAVADLVHRCGYLPLAISLTASLLTRRPSWSVADLVQEVQRTAGRLLTVRAENRTVAAVFDLSYQNLPADRQRFFRRLGLHPGVDIDGYAAAALDGIPAQRAAGYLDELYDDHLLDEPAYRRYRMHDLIREYAHALIEDTDPVDVRERALDRLLDHYRDTAARAGELLRSGTVPASPPVPASSAVADGGGGALGFADRDQAVAWLRTERDNLIACVRQAAGHSRRRHVVALAASMASSLRTDGLWPQAMELQETALAAAELVAPEARGAILTELGMLRYLTGDYPRADAVLHQALDLHVARDDRRGQAATLIQLGTVRWLSDDYPAAIGYHQRALDLYRDLGDRRGQADAAYELGRVRHHMNDHPGADALLRQALDAYRHLDDRLGQADALNALGSVRHGSGHLAESDELRRRALTFYRELGDRRGQAAALNFSGAVRRALGELPSSRRASEEALDIYRALGSRLGQAGALDQLAGVNRLTGDYRLAEEFSHRALDLYRAVGDRAGQGRALDHLGIIRYLTGDYCAARGHLHEALGFSRELGDRYGEGDSLRELGAVAYLTGDHETADKLLTEALARYGETDFPDDRGGVLIHLGTARYLTGNYPAADRILQQALDIVRACGARHRETEALNRLGVLHRLIGEPERALARHRDALALARSTTCRLEQARALDGIGRCALDLGDETGASSLGAAEALYRQLGIPEAARRTTEVSPPG